MPARRAPASMWAMATPPVKRYALVPKPAEDGIRRFQLARVSGDPPSPGRLERMEEVAARERTGPADVRKLREFRAANS